jgi:hypothetical protein
MMQSKTFMNMWESSGLENSFEDGENNTFIFHLNDITKPCFLKIIEWLDMHKGEPEPVVTIDNDNLEAKFKNIFKIN